MCVNNNEALSDTAASFLRLTCAPPRSVALQNGSPPPHCRRITANKAAAAPDDAALLQHHQQLFLAVQVDVVGFCAGRMRHRAELAIGHVAEGQRGRQVRPSPGPPRPERAAPAPRWPACTSNRRPNIRARQPIAAAPSCCCSTAARRAPPSWHSAAAGPRASCTPRSSPSAPRWKHAAAPIKRGRLLHGVCACAGCERAKAGPPQAGPPVQPAAPAARAAG